MKALVISGGGSKGAYAGGVASHLMQVQNRDYDIFVGASTGSLLLTHLAIGEIDKLHRVYTNVNQKSIFSLNPFKIKKKDNREYVSINYLTTILQFIKKKRTFGESKNLRKLIQQNYTERKNVGGKQKLVSRRPFFSFNSYFKTKSWYSHGKVSIWIQQSIFEPEYKCLVPVHQVLVLRWES